MPLLREIEFFAAGIPASLKEDGELCELSFVVAERKVFFTSRKLTYTAKFRIDDAAKAVKFSESLKEIGFGFSSGIDDSPGFGFKTESYRLGTGPREGTIEEQSTLFGKKYSYCFDFTTIRRRIQELAEAEGYAFHYQITSIGL